MTNKNICRLFGCLMAASVTGLIACNIAMAQSNKGGKGGGEPSLLIRSGVADYPHWTRVNPKPVIFHAASAAQCAAAFPSQQSSPHLDKYITVYVNETGKRAMLTQEKPAFPVGSVIVKEKRATPTAAPELLTVMVKRPKGYNPGNGDWEYAVLDGKAAQTQAQGKLANCQSCHQMQTSLDYTFRDKYFNFVHQKRTK